MTKTGIIFDLDGTLWDSSRQVVPSWNQILAQYSKKITLEDMQGFMGKTVEDIAALLFPALEEKERNDILYKCCTAEQEYLRKHGGTLYPELETVLGKLKEKYPLYIVSNCHDGYVQAFLKYHRLEDYFSDYEMSGRTGSHKGENIKLIIERNQLSSAVYIGDTQGDKNAADFAGIPFIYAAYGFGHLENEPNVIEKISELLACVHRILYL